VTIEVCDGRLPYVIPISAGLFPKFLIMNVYYPGISGLSALVVLQQSSPIKGRKMVISLRKVAQMSKLFYIISEDCQFFLNKTLFKAD